MSLTYIATMSRCFSLRSFRGRGPCAASCMLVALCPCSICPQVRAAQPCAALCTISGCLHIDKRMFLARMDVANA